MSYKSLFIALFFSTITFSQTLTLTDKSTGEPLELATIISYKPNIYTTTNIKGQASISEFKKSEKIEIGMLGYTTTSISYKELEALQFNYSLSPIALSMDEIIISASKWSQHSDDIPSKIISVTTEDIEFQNPQTSADLLGSTGKVFIQKSQQGGGSPMIRGFATNRLLYSVDGIRMNTAIFRSGNIQNVISIDPFALEKTEVLFGPGSVIYGSDAIGGVMSFQTHTPQLSMTHETIVSGNLIYRHATANHEHSAHFDLNTGGNKWAAVTSLSFNLFDDLKMGSNGPDDYLRPFYVIRENGADVIVINKDPELQVPSGYNQSNFMQKIRFKPNKKWDFNYAYHYSTTSEYSRYDYHLRKRNGNPRYGEWSYGPQKWMMNQVSINLTSYEKWFDQLSLKLAQQFFEESRISRNLNSSKREIRTEKVNAWSGNLDFQKAFGEKNQLIYGLEYVFDDVNSAGDNVNISTNEIENGPSRYPMSNWNSIAAYISNQHKFSENFNFQSGLRYNIYKINAQFDTTFYPFPFTELHSSDGALTGSIGFVYKPIQKFEMSFNASTAFRSPNIDDMGKVFDSEPGSVVVPNPDLKAEYAYSLDLGLAKMFGNHVKADISGYYTYLDQAMVRRAFTLNGESQIMYDGELSDVLALQNAAKATVYGIQAGLEVKLNNGFGIESQVNYQKGDEELDNGETSPSRHAAPFFTNASLNYQKNKFNFQLNTVYTGEKSFNQLPVEEKAKDYMYALDADGNPYSPSWYTLNFKGSYEFSKYLTLTLGIENITDQRYRPYSSGISGAGRSFIFSLKSKF
ncbi:MAG: TonB-dependent receptor [Flavobacteriaceae bacterium]|nr:TonB-dependent receptor [Flavobacteriaceae bacterium]